MWRLFTLVCQSSSLSVTSTSLQLMDDGQGRRFSPFFNLIMARYLACEAVNQYSKKPDRVWFLSEHKCSFQVQTDPDPTSKKDQEPHWQQRCFMSILRFLAIAHNCMCKGWHLWCCPGRIISVPLRIISAVPLGWQTSLVTLSFHKWIQYLLFLKPGCKGGLHLSLIQLGETYIPIDKVWGMCFYMSNWWAVTVPCVYAISW